MSHSGLIFPLARGKVTRSKVKNRGLLSHFQRPVCRKTDKGWTHLMVKTAQQLCSHGQAISIVLQAGSEHGFLPKLVICFNTESQTILPIFFKIKLELLLSSSSVSFCLRNGWFGVLIPQVVLYVGGIFKLS